MKAETGWRKVGNARRAIVLGVSFLLFAIQPTLGGAAIITQTYSETNISVSAGFADFFEYSGGTTNSWTDSADFSAGTFTNTNTTDQPDSVVLDRIGPTGVVAPDGATPWWDTDWSNRLCYEIDHTSVGASSVSEYQVKVALPIDALVADGYLQPDLGDLRAIAADGSTSLPSWADDTADDSVWVQVDTIVADESSEFCIYYGYLPGGASSQANQTEAAVFTYTTAKDIYYGVSEGYAAPGSPISVATYIDNNAVTRSDGTTVTLAATGDLGTFDAVGTTPGSVFSVLGPISAAGTADGIPSLVPISFAGTMFAAPIDRDGQQFSVFAPFGDAEIDLFEGAVLVNSFTVADGTQYTHIADDIGAGSTAIIESDVPILVAHRSDLGGDAFALYPAVAGDFYSVRSTSTRIGYTADSTTVELAGSDGATSSLSGDRGDVSIAAGGVAQGGDSTDGLLISADQPVGVIAHDDGDGNESTIILPSSELSAHYWLPTDSQYVAFSCPTEESAPIPITITPPGGLDRIVSCAGGPDVAWAVDTSDLFVAASATSVSSDDGSPFHAYYEDLTTDAQKTLLGMKQGRQYTWPEPIVTPGGHEGLLETTGLWESATLDTGSGTGVFGLAGLAGTTPANTTMRLQIASIASGVPSSFVGPDGTDSTYFELSSLPAVADFGHDGDRFLRVRVELATSAPAEASPVLDAVSVDSHLPRLDRSLGGTPTTSVATTIDPTVTSTHVLRVKTSDPTITGSTATAVYRGATNLANLVEETVRFVNEGQGINNVQQSNVQVVAGPIPFEQGRPHSVVVDHSAVASGTTSVALIWQLDYLGGGSMFFETDFAIEVTAP